jgi:hypothetical protein
LHHPLVAPYQVGNATKYKSPSLGMQHKIERFAIWQVALWKPSALLATRKKQNLSEGGHGGSNNSPNHQQIFLHWLLQ